jgi:hypothetical protein
MRYYVFIDDERDEMYDRISTTVGYTYMHCHNYDSAIGCIELYKDKELIVDFDHDIADTKTGYDVAKYIVENQIPLLGFKIHSMNSVGVANIRQLLTHYGYREI